MACNGLENVKKGKLFPQRSQGFISFSLHSEMPHSIPAGASTSALLLASVIVARPT